MRIGLRLSGFGFPLLAFVFRTIRYECNAAERSRKLSPPIAERIGQPSLRTEVCCGRRCRNARNVDGRSSGRVANGGRSRDVDVWCARRSRRLAESWAIILNWRWRCPRTLDDGLRRPGMLLGFADGVADGFCDLVLL